MSVQVVPSHEQSVLGIEAAFQVKGAHAAVFRPHFGQAHQQYFTPRWIAEAAVSIAEALYDVHSVDAKRAGYPLRVLDPTCGSARLLAPFAERGHQVFGIELDERLVPVAKRAVGKGSIRRGDVCEYAPAIPTGAFDVAVINPPYGLWWAANDHLGGYELLSGTSIESQAMVLELATRSLWSDFYEGGVLIALMSGKFWDNNPEAAQFVRKQYQIIADLTLPTPYKAEYGIDVDAALLVAHRCDPRNNHKKPAPLTGTFTSENATALTAAVVEAYETHLGKQYTWATSCYYLPKRNYDRALPEIPELNMAVKVDVGTTKVAVTGRGIRPNDHWAGAWLEFLGQSPLETYSQAEGTNTGLTDAYGTLPNILIAGAEKTECRLRALGFDVAVPDVERERIARAAQQYRRDRLPVRELSPMEFLAWYDDGPIVPKADVLLPRGASNAQPVQIISGTTYDLQVRWERDAEQAGEDESFGKGRDAFVLRTYVDRGYLVFHFTAPDGTRFRVREVDAEQVAAMVDAFGLPEVKTVDDLPECERRSWAMQLDRLIDTLAERNGGLRPYPVQREDILRMATKRSVALLYEMGGGKTATSAYWACLRKYKRVLIVTPASVVPGIIEDLTKWGFRVHPHALDHAEISRLRASKGHKPEETEFWVASYESLGLQDGCYDAWSHEVYDRDGNFEGEHQGNHGAVCSAPGCKVHRSQVVKVCPKCGAHGSAWRSVRGSNGGGARVCRTCGYTAWTAGTLTPATAEAESIKSRHMAPLGSRMKRLFSCVILDEVQDAKSKGSLKGETTRALKARGKAVLSGTWLKGYVTDLFWSAGWLLGFGSPLWPFPYEGGSGRFLEQFGTYQFVTKEFANTLQTGKRKLIPSVSNLGRMWRLLSPFTIRRLKDDFLKDLPPKHVEVHWARLDTEHAAIYRRVEEAMQDTLKRELERAEPNMGVISMALWWGRYAASCPTDEGAAHYAGAFGNRINVDEATPEEIRAVIDQLKLIGALLPQNLATSKVAQALELVWDIQAKGEKVIVFTSLRGLYGVLERELKRAGIGYVGMDGVATQKRNGVARAFERSNKTVLLAGTGTLNRGVTINGANHIIILNSEWSPETTLQAEDRCHRPGQTRDVFVHYILASGTVEEQMWELINQKAAAQRAVFDKQAQSKSVEAVLAEAVSAQMQVAKALVEVKRELLPESIAVPEPVAENTPQSVPVAAGILVTLPPATLLPQRAIKGALQSRRKGMPQAQASFFEMLVSTAAE